MKKQTKPAEVNIINRIDLLQALEKVKPGVASKEIIEQSNHFIFEEDRIWAYNDQIAISQEFESHLRGAVKADEFYKLLDKLNDDELTIVVEKGKFLIQGKSITAKIKIDPEIKLQSIQAPDISLKNWQILPKNFISSISLCLFSASQDMIHPELTCLFITGKTVFSTDGFRATKKEMKTKVKADFLLPTLAAKELIKYDVHKVFIDTKGWLHFVNKERTLFSCRIFADIKYPEKIWDFFDVEGTEINLPDSFDKVIDRISTLVTADFDLDRFISLEIKKGILICKGKGPYGSISEKIELDYEGDDICIKVHPGFLIEILSQLDKMIVGERLLFKSDKFEHCICLSS